MSTLYLAKRSTPTLLRPLSLSLSLSLSVRSPATHFSLARRSLSTQTLTQQSQAAIKDVVEDGKRSFQPHPADSRIINAATASEMPSASDSKKFQDWVLHHPVYRPGEVDSIQVVRHERKTVGDKFASFLVALARKGFDFVTRYKHASPEEAIEAMKKAGKTDLSLEQLRKEGYVMTEEQWLARILYLESIAGVPGMVGAVIRHLQSLRLMKRDGGWINTLLSEAENERMHLLTFLKIKQPTWFFRFLVLGTQGVFWNLFFLAYLINPRVAHRFVGYLEEEACLTYTQIVEEIKRGNIPEWAPGSAQKVPQIAIDYWRLPPSATMLDLLLSVRADEANHRFTNHTLANLKRDDFNPFAVKAADVSVQGRVYGFEREESLEWSKRVETHKLFVLRGDSWTRQRFHIMEMK